MMPTNKLRWSVLASVGLLLLACGGGVTTLGTGDDGGGGTSGEEMAKGGSKSTPAAGMHSGSAGAGARPGGGGCDTDMECGVTDLPCEPCANGGQSCLRARCLDGACIAVRDECRETCTGMDCPQQDICEKEQCGTPCAPVTSDPGMGMGTAPAIAAYCNGRGQCQVGEPQCDGVCTTFMDCGTPPPDCKMCPGGLCARFECRQGRCVFGCPHPEPEPEPKMCMVPGDCPVLDDPCIHCPGTMKCAVQACIESQCELVCPVN